MIMSRAIKVEVRVKVRVKVREGRVYLCSAICASVATVKERFPPA
jgi:hypothetical protein